MSDSWIDFCFGVLVAGTGVFLASIAFLVVAWRLDTAGLSACAAKHNVYACEFVARPILSQPQEEKVK